MLRSFSIEKGDRFNHLVAVKPTPIKIGRQSTWLFRCDCGNTRIKRPYDVFKGFLKSCGCRSRDYLKNYICPHATHRKAGSPIYQVWRSMRTRCENPKSKSFKDYGGRGIRVCKRWHSFENFYQDMGDRPSDKHQLDRIDNDGNYSPKNCRWSDRTTQANNKRNNRVITINGQQKTLSEWARHMGVNPSLISCRLMRGWTEKESVLVSCMPLGSNQFSNKQIYKRVK